MCDYRVFTTEIRIVQVVTQLTDGQRREIYLSPIIIGPAIAVLVEPTATALCKGALKRKSLNVEECGHEIRNEFHWSQKSSGTQAIVIAKQDRTSYVAVTYERSVSTAGSDTIPRLVQLLCGSTITRSVRDEELATWEETRGCARRI